MAVLYYRKGEDDDALDEALSGLMTIKEEAMLNDIYFVLVSDQREFAKLGGNSIEKNLILLSHKNHDSRVLSYESYIHHMASTIA